MSHLNMLVYLTMGQSRYIKNGALVSRTQRRFSLSPPASIFKQMKIVSPQLSKQLHQYSIKKMPQASQKFYPVFISTSDGPRGGDDVGVTR